ncbi:uncharacterized protein LOC126879138 [Diabrotica virgifera virgifera]|uniref:Uncharacterized protein n=1 Tax=Diabrotica virgifera virgifera TaxID=50390 RepID=A0ABM5JJF8_DIAVI|nr:uncharacterized protein LOC126879138 [Diabrotica virgifera virgifera]
MSNRARLLLNMALNKNRISRSNAVSPDNLLHNNTDKLSDNFYSKSTPSQEDMQNLCSEPSTYTTNTDDKLHSYHTPQLSPQRTEDESEIDDSDNDPDFKVTPRKKGVWFFQLSCDDLLRLLHQPVAAVVLVRAIALSA